MLHSALVYCFSTNTCCSSINWARILAQITYYFHSYFQLIQSPSYDSSSVVRFVVPTGNFGDILAGYFAKRMGLPVEKLVIATNENDILHRFWRTGHYEKHEVHGKEAEGGIIADGAKAHEDGVKETLSPAMDILVSSNFERLLWFLAYQVYGQGAVTEKRKKAGEQVNTWLQELKTSGGFEVEKSILDAAKNDFESERVSDQQTIDTIREVYGWGNKSYILDPHSAIGIAATVRSVERASPKTHHVSLSTAHPAKFSNAVELALSKQSGFDFNSVLPKEFIGLEDLPRRVTDVKRSEGLEGVRHLVIAEVEAELAGKR
jgi:threonine synthase